MEIYTKKIRGIFEIKLKPLVDRRGSLTRLYDREMFPKLGIGTNWAEESIVRSVKKNTLRGLHVSLPPKMESKVIVATRGSTLWIALDIRSNSKTFGQWESLTLSAEDNNMLYTEKGFAHGCLSLTNNADLLIKASEHFKEIKSTGILWNDPDIAIDWPLNGELPIISEEHEKYLSFKDFLKKYRQNL